MTEPGKKKIGSLQQIDRAELMHVSKKKVSYEIIHGWDAKASLQCDISWKAAWLELFELIEKAEPDETRQAEILESISTEDMHWRWFDKAIAFSSDEYEWFHLHADGKPQAACLIYHPKPSALEEGDIFYVEFVAVAPWNRSCKIRPREFAGLGEIILRAAQRFAVNQLKLRPGFCLHSLPKAEAFYTKLNMVKVPDKAKDDLTYFELPQVLAVKLMEAR
jgi:hypothetical protein